MNAYEQKLEARRARYAELAGKANAASDAAYQRSRSVVGGIEMGQPILVGHHSEGRHRRDLARSDAAMRQSIEATNKAQHYASKAASVGTGGISSDDPQAIDKLRAQLVEGRTLQTRMKAANAAIRSSKTPEGQVAALVKIGYVAAMAELLIKPDFAGRVGFPAYRLSNHNANLARLEKRIAELNAASEQQDITIEGPGYVYREDTEENRVMFEFEGKPAERVRAVLKAHAFKWSPKRGAWVRFLNGAGRYAATCVRAEIDKSTDTTSTQTS